MKNLGFAIKELRNARKWTQDDLHIRLNVSMSTVARFEANGTVEMSSAAKMAEWAIESGRPDLAVSFRDAIISELGSDVVNLIRKDLTYADKSETPTKSAVHQRRLRA